jgi:phosphate transport system protein
MDTAAAQEVLRQDRELDAEYAASLRRVVTRAMEDPRLMRSVIEAAFVMRSLERIGDHARNVARHVLFACPRPMAGNNDDQKEGDSETTRA